MQPSSDRYAYIDGLRGFAASWIVLFHLWNRWYPKTGGQEHWTAVDFRGDPVGLISCLTLGSGFSAVTLFFVLSGFCIHLPQARHRRAAVPIRDFARRRFWRLYPAYAASIVFAVAVLALPKLLLALGGRTIDWWAAIPVRAALVDACFLQQLDPAALELNGVYWTLVYEVQFYAAYPLLLWCLGRVGLVAVGTILLGLEVGLAFEPPGIACFFPAKYFEWFLGVVAAEMVAGRVRRLPGPVAATLAVVGLVGGISSSLGAHANPLRDLLFAVGYFGLILQVGSSRGAWADLWRSRLLVGLGVFSYSLYLIHVPMIDITWIGLDRVVAAALGRPNWARWASLVAIPLSVGAAYLFYRAFERPFLASRPAKAPVAAPAPIAEHAAP